MKDLPPISRASAAGTTTVPIAGVVSAGVASSLPGYELFDELGRGGMGVVYRARDGGLRRDVAVKFLQDKLASPSASYRFLAEARITGQLQHPGIPPVHQVGSLPDGRPFLVMKLIQGRTLSQILADRADPSAERGWLLSVFEAICQAVAYAHSRSIIHRDLKPANVMVGEFGEVQVMDWGLAKLLGTGGTGAQRFEQGPDQSTLSDPEKSTDIFLSGASTDVETKAGQAMGTPAYMPPEQARGDLERIGPPSDVFALGGILCTILTGRPPYTGGQDVIRRAAEGDIADALARLASSGAESEWVSLGKHCLAPDPKDRFANAGELATAVSRLRTAAEERARQAELDRIQAEGERAKAEVEARELRKRRRIQGALLVSLILLVGAGGAFAWWQERQERDRATERTRLEGEKLAADLQRQVEQQRAAAAEESADEASIQFASARGRWREVVNLSTRALASKRPDVNRILLRQVRAYQALGDAEADRVLATLDAKTDLRPNERAEVDLLIGDGMIIKGDPNEGRRRIRKALTGDHLLPADREYARGLLAETLTEALDRQRAAVNFDAAHHGGRAQLTYLLVFSGRWEEAGPALTAAEALFPEDPTFVIIRVLHDSLRGEGMDKIASHTDRIKKTLGAEAAADLQLAAQTLRAAFGKAKVGPTDQMQRLVDFQLRLAQLAIRVNPVVAGPRLQVPVLPPVFEKSYQVLAKATTSVNNPFYVFELGAAARAWPDAILLKAFGDLLIIKGRHREALVPLKEAITAPTIYPGVHKAALVSHMMAMSTVFQVADAKTKTQLRPDLEADLRLLLQTYRGEEARGLTMSVTKDQTLGWVMADIAWQAGFLDLARSILFEWRTVEPDSPILLGELATVEYSDKHFPEAIEAGRKAMANGLADSQLVKNVTFVLKSAPGELQKLARQYASLPLAPRPREVKPE